MFVTCLAASQTSDQVTTTLTQDAEPTTTSTSSANTIINSVKENDDSTVEFGMSEAINVILCAIGVVIIFLGIAILIKIKR